ncbi:MAG: type IV pilus twitching motility protein PilT [Candidatus Eisenbacteria sp.]|nr:type IV pilus twitching motility protein PilT [Candidatus Eisenbacteria bacterium]
MAELRNLLQEMVDRGASDLHIVSGSPPHLRVDGALVPCGESLSMDEARALGYSVLSEAQKKEFEINKEVDLAFSIQGVSRFRANVFTQRGAVSVAIRRIPFEIPLLEDLGLPNVVESMIEKNKGLVLVTGPTGSGKSTSMAAMLNRINHRRQCHIVTVEDPIEYVHQNHKSIVNQRQVKSDTVSFGSALKHVLRQDPDVILIGEMRDPETMLAALTIAETGHLAFATLHTNSAYESVNRIADSFPLSERRNVLSQLAFVLEGVITQQLLPRSSGKGRVLVSEVLICTPAIRAVIREDKIHQVYGLMQAGQKFGMQTMNMSLASAVRKGRLTSKDALNRSLDGEELAQLLAQQTVAGARAR